MFTDIDYGFQVALDKSSAENEQLKEENKRLKEALDSYENGLLSLNWANFLRGNTPDLLSIQSNMFKWLLFIGVTKFLPSKLFGDLYYYWH